MTAVIEALELCKRYGQHVAVDRLRFGVAEHRITGFLGRNGAGKSTTIKMMLGMIAPTSGSGRVLGHPIDDPEASLAIRRRVAYVGEDKGLYGYMTVGELIRFTRGFYADWQPAHERRLLAQYALPLDRKVKALSKGMRTKLALLLALARRPALLILDEPTEGLDPVSIEQLLQELVGRGADGTTVFFSSHQIVELEQIADHVAIIDRGRAVIAGPLDDLREQFRRVQIVFDGEAPDVAFRSPGVQRVRRKGRVLTVLSNAGADAIIDEVRTLNPISVDASRITLKEIFLETVVSED